MKLIEKIIMQVICLPIFIVIAAVQYTNKVRKQKCVKNILNCINTEMIKSFGQEDFFVLVRVVFSTMGFKWLFDLNQKQLCHKSDDVMIFDKCKNKYLIKVNTCSNQANKPTMILDTSFLKSSCGCDYALVISNQYFSSDVTEKAVKNGVKLINCDDLMYLVKKATLKKSEKVFKHI